MSFSNVVDYLDLVSTKCFSMSQGWRVFLINEAAGCIIRPAPFEYNPGIFIGCFDIKINKWVLFDREEYSILAPIADAVADEIKMVADGTYSVHCNRTMGNLMPPIRWFKNSGITLSP